MGDRLKGSIVGPGGDWLLIGEDGYGRLDVRNTVQTVDGAVIYVQSYGLVELTPEVMAVFGGGRTTTDFGEQYFVTSPRMETGDERRLRPPDVTGSRRPTSSEGGLGTSARSPRSAAVFPQRSLSPGSRGS